MKFVLSTNLVCRAQKQTEEKKEKCSTFFISIPVFISIKTKTSVFHDNLMKNFFSSPQNHLVVGTH